MAEAEIKEVKKIYHKHKDVRVKVVEDQVLEVSWKKKGSPPVRLDLSAYPDGTLVVVGLTLSGITGQKGEDDFDWEEGKLVEVLERVVKAGKSKTSSQAHGDDDFAVIGSDEDM